MNKRGVTHGHAARRNTSPTYKTWASMHQRCGNPHNPNFPHYGGRGIVVCDRWNDFPPFLEDMGERPIGESLDRINNDGNYEPGNCRWVPKSKQNSNTRRTDIVSFNGETMCLTDWASKLGMSQGCLWRRIYKYGWTIAAALNKPPKRIKGVSI